MNSLGKIVAGTVLLLSAVPAWSQLSVGGFDGEQFVTAVRSGDNDKALKLITETPTIINSRDAAGRTALVSAISNRDTAWTAELLRRGADPDLAERAGDTPLIAAARISFNEAAQWLIESGASIDKTNKMGETPLIVAVQRRNLPLVKLLLQHGANPDKSDSAQGYSARDYAKRDNRSPELLRAIEAKKPAS
jgi:ankyrin repeat protein